MAKILESDLVCAAHPEGEFCGRAFGVENIDLDGDDFYVVPDNLQPDGFYSECCHEWCHNDCGLREMRVCRSCDGESSNFARA